MSRRSEPLLFFLRLPDLAKLCCITVSLNSLPDHGDARNKQLTTCREMLFQFADVIACPVIQSFEITVIMGIKFFTTGVIQAYIQMHSMQMSAPRRVLPSSLQACLSYTLIARLAPDWNKAGQFLIRGKNFLSTSGKMNAIVMELNAREGQLCVSLECSSVRLPPPTLEEFDIAPSVLKNFNTCRSAVIQASSISNNWCYILPSMKMGQIISLSHQVAPECPFKTYSDIQKHWSTSYGYELPQVEEEGVVYCSMYFKMVGEKLFTYPLSCIRTQAVQVFPRTDLQEALNTFLLDLRVKLRSICGFPVQLTSRPLCYTTSLITPGSQSFGVRPLNLATRTTSRPIQTQHPGCYTPGLFSQRESFKPSPYAPIAATGTGSLCSSSAGASTTEWSSRNLWTPQNESRVMPVFKNKDLVFSVSKPGSEAGKVLERRGQTFVFSEKVAMPGPSLLSSLGQDRVSAGSAGEEAAGCWFECKPKKPKSSIQEVDVENYARSNQLSKVNAVTLQTWLKKRGIRVRSRDKKEMLITKVLCCLRES